MEKQEFRPGYPLWIWAVIAIMLVACTCLFIAHGRYASLLVLTPSLLIMVRLLSVYTITPDSFTLAIRGMKPRHVFPLQNITEIEKEYTKSGKLKSIVIRYRKEGMYHNFLVIKKDDVNSERYFALSSFRVCSLKMIIKEK